jgi:uncharacterized repeat protein (TIGR03803 family)
MHIPRRYTVFALYAMTTMALGAQTVTTLHSFDSTDGEDPGAALIEGADGNFYGTTIHGGANGQGTVFKISSGGTFTLLYSFCSLSKCSDGASPFAPLFQSNDGNLYGTTAAGGSTNGGTVFKITLDGSMTTLYSFCIQSACADGQSPLGGVVQGSDGDLYGTTEYGGTNGGGAIFKLTTTGALTTLFSFSVPYCEPPGCIGGFQPYAGLTPTANGDFYGTTFQGGTSDNCAFGCGTIFKMNPHGAVTTVHNFNFTDGAYIPAGLVQAENGDLWGTANNGGGNFSCDSGCGSVFKMTPSGELTSFAFDYADGEYPVAGVIQATNGNFYGTTPSGDNGWIFKITPSGVLTGIFGFCNPPSNCPGGYAPSAALLQATDGDFYGTTSYGGVNGGFGTIFRLSTGLGPFVKIRPSFGAVGAHIQIQGTDLTGTTSVSFNGTPAVFKVEGASLITTTVPTGATTGTVQVVTPAGALSSNVPFRVLQ